MPEPADSQSAGGFDDIVVLCGAATVFILVQHATVALTVAPVSDDWTGTIYAAFWSGYDVFFAALGYVGARILAPRLAGAAASEKLRVAADFWLACAWRLLPSAWLWLAVTVLCTVAFNRSAAFGTPAAAWRSALIAAGNIENLAIVWFGHAGGQDPVYPYWAVSLAAQCCLALPLVVALCQSRLVAIVPVVILAQVLATRTPDAPASFVRTDALLLGVLIAVWTAKPTYRLFEPAGLARWRAGQFIVPALVFFLMASASSQQLHLVPFRAGIVTILAAVLVWLASYNRAYILRERSLAKRMLAWIGVRALPFYLVHIPACLAAREIWFRLSGGALHAQAPHYIRYLATALVFAVVFAELTHRLIEAPLQRIAPPSYRRLRAATPGAAHEAAPARPTPLLADR